MNQSTKVIAITASACLAAGLVFSGLSFAMGASRHFYMDSSGVHVAEKERVRDTQTLSPYQNVELNLRYASLSIEEGDEFTFSYEWDRQDGAPTCEVRDGTLYVEEPKSGSRVTFMNIDLSFEYQSNHVTLTVPRGQELQNVSIENENGSVHLDDLKAAELSLKADYGSVRLNHITAGQFHNRQDNGSLKMNNCQITAMTSQLDYGSAHLQDNTLGALDITMQNGSFKGEDNVIDKLSGNLSYGSFKLLDSKTNGLSLKNQNGSTEIAGEIRGVTSVIAEYGSVKINADDPKELYSYNLTARYGSIKVDGKGYDGSAQQTGGENQIQVNSQNGSVKLHFNS